MGEWARADIFGLKARNGDGAWPTAWEGHEPYWPAYLYAPPRYVPERTSRAYLICHREQGCQTTTVWATPQEGREALAELTDRPCDPLCERRHSLTYTEPGRLTVLAGPHDPPVAPARLAAALRAAGYQRPPPSGGRDGLYSPKDWPHPSRWNPKLGGPTMTEDEHHAAVAAAVESAAGRELTPHPGGLSGRIRDAEARADAALAEGDLTVALAEGLLADTLTDALLAEYG